MSIGHPDFVGVSAKQLLDVLISQNITGNNSLTRPASGQFSLFQPGYEILLNIGSLGNPSPTVSVELQWYDSTFGALIDAETYYFYSGNANGHVIHGRGPTKGDRLVVVISNNGGATIVVNYTLLQTGRIFTREFWKTVTKGGLQPVYTGLTAANSNASANMLASENHVLLLNTAINVVLPLYTGTVRLFGTTTDVGAGNSTWIITTASDRVLPGGQTLVGKAGQSGFSVDGNTSLWVPDIALPRSQCQLSMQNGNTTTTETLTATIVPQEDRT